MSSREPLMNESSTKTKGKNFYIFVSYYRVSIIAKATIRSQAAMKSLLVLLTLALWPNVAVNAFVQVSAALKTRQIGAGFTVKSSLLEDSATADTRAKLSELPPVLQDIVDERNEFRLNLGHAMDVLKHDYPEILRRAPGKYSDY